MKHLIIIFISSLLFSVQSKKKEKAFFDFDQIDYYHVDFDSKKFKPIQNVESKEEKAFYNILRFEYPTNIAEKNFITDLKKSYKQKELSKTKYNSIRNIYSEKKHSEAVFFSCSHFYRDILIFKKSGKIVGISKICFECNLHHTVGSKQNVENLGQSGDFQILKKILQ